MIVPESPPGFIVKTEAAKAAYDNGFRLERGTEEGWLRFASTTAEGAIWIAGAAPAGPWLLALERPEVAAEIGTAPDASLPGPGAARFAFSTLPPLYAALDRTWRLAVSLPEAPLARFRKATAGLPRTTEAERQVIACVGQSVFRDALLAYWHGNCPMSGIAEPALLRASHIVPWSECESDAHRLDVHNGLLLSALWDAAFDAGLIGFAADGRVLTAPALGREARAALGLAPGLRLGRLTPEHHDNLAWHRARYDLAG